MRPVTLVAILVLSTIPVGPAAAEILGPGTYRGTYHLDRWGQDRFAFLFVSPDVAKQLAPHRGRPLEIHVRDLRQPMNPGAGLVSAIDGLRDLGVPVTLELSFPDESEGRPHLRVTGGATVRIRVTATNGTGSAVVLGHPERDRFLLEFARQVPATPGSGEKRDHWAFHDSFTSGALRRDDLRTVQRQRVDLTLHDQTLDAAALPRAPSRAPSIEKPVRLAPGASHSLTVTLENLPANEMEIAVLHQRRGEDGLDPVFTESERLRLDALATRPIPLDDLEVTVHRHPSIRPTGHGPAPLLLRFRNRGERRIQFGLETVEGRAYLRGDLLCFDRAGKLLPVDYESGDAKATFFRLAPGELHAVYAVAPVGTSYARVAFVHRLDTRTPPPDHHSISNGYLFSAALRLD